ncbi:hypothetical protein NO995_11605 [Aestuariibaculum sp. M13]|uniref:imelysin family protein n=1 Tax=Aestuariibaculum sp. M13 TaxID=2967132 RepID=UPI002159E426|nr:imelysin family protein [Aestuariibaculum sp. M13]MCR8668330.1 hypothetical protein [Aestuariibaculum sp. M13]
MKKLTLTKFALALGIMGVVSCNEDNDDKLSISKSAVIENYAEIVYQNYLDSYNDAVNLETVVNVFVSQPTEANFENAKSAWKQARESYGTTEAFRFVDGPIDDENGPEALINGWPLDENFIDYVEGVSDSGIINDLVNYPSITKQLLIDLNEDGGEKNISVGFHAIEFLLWGQDLTAPSEELAGLRPYTDFVDGGTADNQGRRRDYLLICAELLTENLQYLVDAWAPGAAYRTYFTQELSEDEALKKMFNGAAILVYSELAIERVNVALFNQDQEDEHSCFSDNTHRDVRLNLQASINVYKGTYGNISGLSIADLVAEVNPELALEIQGVITDVVAKTDATLIPFDLAIAEGPESIEGAKVTAAKTAMQLFGSELSYAANSLGITLNEL